MATAIKEQYDTKLDAKRRVTIRKARAEYYHVTHYEDGSIRMEPRVLIAPAMLEQIEAGAKRYLAGERGKPLNWDELPEV